MLKKTYRWWDSQEKESNCTVNSDLVSQKQAGLELTQEHYKCNWDSRWSRTCLRICCRTSIRQCTWRYQHLDQIVYNCPQLMGLMPLRGPLHMSNNHRVCLNNCWNYFKNNNIVLPDVSRALLIFPTRFKIMPTFFSIFFNFATFWLPAAEEAITRVARTTKRRPERTNISGRCCRWKWKI